MEHVNRKESGRTGEKKEQKKGPETPISPRVKVQLVGTEPFYGPGMKTLLTCIQKRGSVRDACEMMGLSYSKGRRMIERAERELGYTIVERSHGGRNGGSARVSERGTGLLERYERFEREIEEAAREKYREIFQTE